jgi:hypothetical protein
MSIELPTPEPIDLDAAEALDAAEPTPNGTWAAPMTHFRVEGTEGADGGSVNGRRVSGPVQGFGRLWQKTYKVRLDDVTISPQHVVAEWKAHYGEFWPEGNRFTAPLAGVAPGEVALISGKAGGLTLSTGVLVLYADEVSFSFLTPEGHPFAGMITFSAFEDDGATTAQVQLLIRAQDPMVELGMAFGGHRKEDRIWQHTLRALATHFASAAAVSTTVVCVDKKRQWNRFGNVKHDAVLYTLTKPFRRAS